MAPREVALQRIPTHDGPRVGIIAHRTLVGVGGDEACAALLKGRGLSHATLQVVGASVEEWAVHCVAARVLAIPRQDDAELSEEAWDLLLIALATGLPLVSTGRGGLAPFLTHGVEGYVASSKHDAPLDLSPAVAKLLTDDTLFQRFSLGARSRVIVIPRGGGVMIAPAAKSL